MRVIALLLLVSAPALAQTRPVEPNRDPAKPDEAMGAIVNKVFEHTNIPDKIGLYMHLGGGWTGTGPGISGSLGLFHHTLFGGEIETTSRLGKDTRVAASLRIAPLRLGLTGPWRDGKAPNVAVLLSARAGAFVLPTDGRVGPLAGVDAELLLWRRFVVAVRTSIAPVRAVDGDFGIWPTAVLAIGVGPGGRYGAD